MLRGGGCERPRRTIRRCPAPSCRAFRDCVPRVKPGRLDSSKKQRDALSRPALGVGLRRQNDEVAQLAVGDEDLLAVDDEIVAVDERAWVRTALRSLPACGSVIPSEPMASPRDHLGQASAASALPFRRRGDSVDHEVGMDQKARVRSRRRAKAPRTRRRQTDNRGRGRRIPPARCSKACPFSPALQPKLARHDAGRRFPILRMVTGRFPLRTKRRTVARQISWSSRKRANVQSSRCLSSSLE